MSNNNNSNNSNNNNKNNNNIVSGVCGPQFLSNLPKRFTHLCRAL